MAATPLPSGACTLVREAGEQTINAAGLSRAVDRIQTESIIYPRLRVRRNF